MSEKRQPRRDDKRGQLVLIAAVALAVVLIPLVLAYMQLGYHADIHASSPTLSESDVEQPLQHALHDTTADIPAEYSWHERDEAVQSVSQSLATTTDTLNRSAVEDGTLIQITPNQSAATAWHESNCPGGPDREFGDCVAREGLVVQDRDGRTHVLGVAYDIAISTSEKDIEFTTVIEPR